MRNLKLSLEIEIEAIKREKDESKLKALRNELANLKEERQGINSKWLSEKSLVDRIQKAKSNIEIYNIQNLDETSSNNEPVLAPSVSHHIFNTNKKYGYNYDIKLNAHSIYNDESYDIKRMFTFSLGNIN